MYKFNKNDIIEALMKVGIQNGDAIFIHSNMGFFGPAENINNLNDYCALFFESIMDVIGESGTLVVPAFSCSFFNNNVFDIKNTKSTTGAFSEYIRLLPNALRSIDPNFSVCAVGKSAEYFTSGIEPYTFGNKAFFHRFYESSGKICNFNFDSGSTFIHYVEKQLNVPYRYDKGFKGSIIDGNRTLELEFFHFVRALDDAASYPDFTKFDNYVKTNNIAKTANLGKGQIVSISAKDTFNTIKEQLSIDGSFLIKGQNNI